MSTIDGAPTGGQRAVLDGAWTVQPGPTPIGKAAVQKMAPMRIMSPQLHGSLDAGRGDIDGPAYIQGRPVSIVQRVMQIWQHKLGFSAPYPVQDTKNNQIAPQNRNNLDYGYIPARVPYLWRGHIDFWAGMSQHGFTQQNYGLRLPLAQLDYATRGMRSIYGMNYGSPNIASTAYIPATFVPTAY